MQIQESGKAKKKIRVILIEDHKLMRVGLKSLFEKYDDISIITEAESGKEGIEKVKVHKPDVVIIDVGLNDISGVEAAKRILAEQGDVKIMMLTSHLRESDIMESLKAGVYAYVLKDINSDMLAMVLRSVNDGAMWLDPKVVPIIRESGNGMIPAKA